MQRTSHSTERERKCQSKWYEARGRTAFGALLPKGQDIKIINFINQNGLQDIFPNVLIVLRIFLTIPVPVTVASAERCFSKLRLIKNYLRSTLADERL